jgi:hypothetical protein
LKVQKKFLMGLVKAAALCVSNDWLFYHDNAPAHAAQWFPARNKTAVVPHPPLLPRSGPLRLLALPENQNEAQGRRFNDVEEIEAKSQAASNAVQKEEFQKCSHKWENRWNRCIAALGE